jgi:hypothetical protein
MVSSEMNSVDFLFIRLCYCLENMLTVWLLVCCFIETTLALLRHPDCCISAYSTVTTLFASIILVSLFNRLHSISCFQMFNHWNDVTLRFILQCNVMRTSRKRVQNNVFIYVSISSDSFFMLLVISMFHTWAPYHVFSSKVILVRNSVSLMFQFLFKSRLLF